MSISGVTSASSYLTSLYSTSSSTSASSTSSDTSTASSVSTDTTSDYVANPDGELSKDDFLQMLITKLKYQDPLSVDDTDMTASMAQYSQLETSQNSNTLMEEMSAKIDDMNTNFVSQMALSNTGQAVSLAGKSVNVQVTDTDGNVTENVTGTVSTVKFVDGVPMLVIDGTEYSMSDVVEVYAS